MLACLPCSPASRALDLHAEHTANPSPNSATLTRTATQVDSCNPVLDLFDHAEDDDEAKGRSPPRVDEEGSRAPSRPSFRPSCERATLITASTLTPALAPALSPASLAPPKAKLRRQDLALPVRHTTHTASLTPAAVLAAFAPAAVLAHTLPILAYSTRRQSCWPRPCPIRRPRPRPRLPQICLRPCTRLPQPPHHIWQGPRRRPLRRGTLSPQSCTRTHITHTCVHACTHAHTHACAQHACAHACTCTCMHLCRA